MHRSHFRVPVTFFSVALLLLAASVTYDPSLSARAETGCPLTPGAPYQSPAHSAVYIVTDRCTRQYVNSPDVYFSHKESWHDVRVVPETVLVSVPRDPVPFVSWGVRREYADGTLMKTTESPRWFLLSGGALHPIESAAVIIERGLVPEQAIDVAPEVIAKYPKASTIRAEVTLR